MTTDEAYAPLWGHIQDLRRTLLQMIAIIICGIVLCFTFYGPLIGFLIEPLKMQPLGYSERLIEERLEHIRVFNQLSGPQTILLPENALEPSEISQGVSKMDIKTYRLDPGSSLVYSKSIPSSQLVVLGPLEGMLTALKTSLWLGAVATSPLWLLILLRFITPALHREEKRLIWPFLATSLVFILVGCTFAYAITIPIANAYLTAFNQVVGMNFWSLERYLDYTLFLILANGFAFELCVVGIFAVNLGLVSAEMLVSKRRFAIVAAFIIAALLTPPDVLTQLMLAIPLIFLYEGLIIYARLTCRLKLAKKS